MVLNESASAWKRYGIAVLAVVTAVAARAILSSLIGSNVPYITFFPAVIFSALYGGFRVGILSTALSAAALRLKQPLPPKRL